MPDNPERQPHATSGSRKRGIATMVAVAVVFVGIVVAMLVWAGANSDESRDGPTDPEYSALASTIAA